MTHTDRSIAMRIIVALVVLLLAADLLYAQDSTRMALTKITYLTASSAYIDAGTEQGIAVGARLEVTHGDSVVAILRAAYVSARRASCSIESQSAELQVGDQVRFQPVTVPDSAVTGQPDLAARADTAAVAPPPVARPRTSAGLHGRIGVRYMVAHQSSGASYSQPALDLRLDGPIGNSGISVGIDVRARRTNSLWADGTSDQSQSYRVYGFTLAFNPARSPFRLTVGRQFSAPLASVNFFDGLMAEYQRPRWGAGLFAGTQPDPVDFGYSGATREAGGFLQFRNAPGASTRWSLTSGVVGSYQSGVVNREFGFLQTSLYAKRFSLYLSQEVDYNRGWKTKAGEKTFSPTSTYASLSLRASDALTFRAGFDNRRNVRLYRDFINPVTQFDDAYREGFWGGVTLNAGSGYHLGLDARNSTGGGGGNAKVFTLALGSDRVLGSGISLRTRSTRYLTDTNRGWLHSVSLGISPSNASQLELNGGWRSNSNALDNPESSRLSWIGLDFDLSLGRAWYLLLSANHESGSNAMNQVFGGLSLRF